MYRLFRIISIVFILASCEKEVILDDCFLSAGFIKVETDDLPCNYTAVYRYDGELYAIFNCCLCNGFFPPTNCDGEALCTIDNSQTCFDDFFKTAEYLYAVVEE